MANSIIAGNDFRLIIRAKKSTGAYLADMDLADVEDLRIYLTRAGRSKVLQSYTLDEEGHAVIYVSAGVVTNATYGIEMVGVYGGARLRAHNTSVFTISGHGGGNSGVLNDYYADIVFVINVAATDVYVQNAIEAHNEDEASHPHLLQLIEEAGDVDDVQIDGESIVDENKIAKIDSSQFGKVDDVKVNGMSVVSNKEANITIPEKVSDLPNDADYATKSELTTGLDAKQDTITAVAEPTIADDGGNPSASVDFEDGEMAFAFKNLKLRFSDLTAADKAELKGDKGDQGDSAVYDPSSPDAPDFVMANTTGQSTTKAMTQKAVTDAIASISDNVGIIREMDGWAESDLSATHLTDGTRKVIVVKVNEGDIIKVIAQSEKAASGALVSTLEITGGHWSALKEDNTAATSRFNVPTSGSIELTAPASARFFVANARDISGGFDYTPEILVNGRTPDIADNVKSISDVLFGKTMSLSGNGRTWSARDIVLPQAKRYRISLGATSWSLPSTIYGTDYVFSINSVGNDDTLTLIIGVQYSQIQSIRNYYDINVPATNCKAIRIGFRAASGYELSINIKELNSDDEESDESDGRYDHGENLWIESDGSITNIGTQQRYFYYFVCNGGDTISIAPGELTTSFAFIKNGAAITFNGAKRTLVTEAVTITAPDHVDYIAVGGFDRANSNDYSPSSVTINGVQKDILIDPSYPKSDVRAYGALGDGAVNDTIPLNRAFQNGGNIKVPKGTYIVSAPVTVYSHSMVIMDKEAKIVRKADSSALCVMRTKFDADTVGYNGVTDFTLIGGVLDMNYYNSHAGACLAMCHASNVRIEGVTMQNARNEYHTIDMGSMKNVKIIDCVLKNPQSNSQYAEMIQIDLAGKTSFPYYDYAEGSACWDGCGCDNVEIRGCELHLSGFNPAFGNHNPSSHVNINIHDNVVYGSGKNNTNNPRGCFAFTTSPYFGNEPNKSECLIHHNIINDCRYIVRTHEGSESHLYIRDNIFKNFVSVKQSDSDTGIELLNNIEINEEN